MDTAKIFQAFVDDIRKTFPDLEATVNLDNDVKSFETFYSHALKILQKDDTFFTDETRTMFGIDLSKMWLRDIPKEEFWKHLQLCTIASFVHGDLKEKIGSIIDIFKAYWLKTGTPNDEVDKILNDKASEDHFKKILEYIAETRLAKMFMDVMENLDFSELNLNLENPEQMIEMLKNPEHPTIKKVMSKIQAIIKTKMERGEITQQKIQEEIEAIKAKVTSIFGNIFNDALGGTRGETAPNVLMGNSPEARRQRMLARLQKKQREKTSR